MNNAAAPDTAEQAPTNDASRAKEFQATLQRARLKARGIIPRNATPEQAGDMTQRAAPDDQALSALLTRILSRAQSRPSEPDVPRPAPVQLSAAEHRLRWYIPKRHWGNTLANYEPKNATQHDALRATTEWVASVEAGEGGALALVGAVGTGKSHLMYAAIRHLNERGVNAGAWGWYDLSLLMRQAKTRGEDEYPEAHQARGRLFTCQSFGLDEIRPTSGTEFDATELASLMTRAHREQQGVIVTSNYADRKLAEIIGLAALDRFTQVHLVGESYRGRHLRAL